MPSLVRNSTGLLLNEDFSASHGWTSGTGFSLVSDPTFVCFGGVANRVQLQADPRGSDTDGAREGQLYIESANVWYMVYDAGDHVTGWRQFIAKSVDRGYGWSKSGALANGVDNGSGGSYSATAGGWFEKRSSTYYGHRGTAGAWFPAPDIGLPADPYAGDIWHASDPFSTWTFDRSYTGTGWADTSINPGSVVLNSGTYYLFNEGRTTTGGYKVGYATASSPGGPYTLNATPLLSNSDFTGPRVPENAKVFFYTPFSKWVMLLNLIEPGGTFTDRNAICVSSSLTSWSGATKFVTQRSLAQCDSIGQAIGVACHITGPDGALISENGYVPFTYDCDPQASSPGWHRGRTIRGDVFEPAASKLHYTDGTTTRHSYSQTLSHTDFVAEFEVDFTALATGADVSFEYRSNGTTGYRLTVRADSAAPRLLLQTMAGTSIQSNTTGTAIVEAGVMHRIRISAVGSQHDAWIDGEHQINVSDATYASGTQVAISAVKVTADVRLLHMRAGSTVTVRGLPENHTLNVRTWGGLPVAQVNSNSQGVATYVGQHFPITRLEILGDPAGDAQTSDLLIWGGDDLTLQGGLMAEQFINRETYSGTTLNGSAIAGATSITVLAAAPIASGFRVKIAGASAALDEVAQVTAGGTGLSWTVNVEGGTGLVNAHASGATVQPVLSKGGLVQFQTDTLALASRLLPTPAQTSITGTTTLNSAHYNTSLICSGTTSNYPLTFPDATVAPVGTVLEVTMSSALTKAVTLTPASGTQLNGRTSWAMFAGESAFFVCDGVKWVKRWGTTIPRICLMRLTASQAAIVPSSETPILLNSVDTDNTGTVGDTAGNRMVIPRTSKYDLTGFVMCDNAASSASRWISSIFRDPNTGTYAILLQREISLVTGSYSGAGPLGFGIPLTINDKLQLSLLHLAAGNLDAYGNSTGASCNLSLAETPDW